MVGAGEDGLGKLRRLTAFPTKNEEADLSNIEPNIIDPTKGPPLPPDSLPDPSEDDHVGSDAVREPGEGRPPIEKDPEEGGGAGDIERA
ncbi:hypothetical protein [Aureimonas ureilytica]|uniref:hypothetical protein n=1 Tax=Aureimonas ureilytica TaxID=401562 RepID=UPI0012DCE7C4|nr:hypothetical protein [Aureimonas ureilytica]